MEQPTKRASQGHTPCWVIFVCYVTQRDVHLGCLQDSSKLSKAECEVFTISSLEVYYFIEYCRFPFRNISLS